MRVIPLISLIILMARLCEAAPAITAVSANAGTIIITGSGFGTHGNNNPDSKPYLNTAWENMEDGTVDDNVFDEDASGSPAIETSIVKQGSTYSAKAFNWKTSRSYTSVFGGARTGTAMYHIGKILAAKQKKIFMSGWYYFPSDFETNIEHYTDKYYQVKIQGMTPLNMLNGGTSGGGKTYFQTRRQTSGVVPIRTETEDGYLSEGDADALANYGNYGTWHRLDIYIDLTKGDGGKLHNWYVDGKKIARTNEVYNSDSELTSRGIIDGFDLLSWAYYYPYQQPDDDYPYPIYMDDAFADLTQARVEISEYATWDETAQHLKEIQIPTAWSDTEITATVNRGQFDVGDTAYVYVINDDGSVNASGHEITIQGARRYAVRVNTD